MEVFEFKEDILPTNGDVFRYINSRTAKRKLELGPTIHEAVTKIHHIWQKADACPMSVTCMIKRCHKNKVKELGFWTRNEANDTMGRIEFPTKYKNKNSGVVHRALKRDSCVN